MIPETKGPSVAATTEGPADKISNRIITGGAAGVKSLINESGDPVEAYRSSGQSPGAPKHPAGQRPGNPTFVQERIVGATSFIRKIFEEGGLRFVGSGGSALCCFHDDQSPSFSADLDTSLYKCFGCGAQGDLVTFLEKTNDITPGEAIRQLKLRLDSREADQRVAGTEPPRRFEIKSSEGLTIAVHVRRESVDGKRFHWERDGKPGLGGLPAVDLPLYGSELAAAWPMDGDVILTEGERKADALRDSGFRALGTVTGASATPGPEALAILDGRDVVLWPDNDQAGQRHMDCIATRLAGRTSRLRVLSWGEQPADDAADFFARGGTPEELLELLLDAPEWRPPALVEVGAGADPGHTFVAVSLDDVQPEEVEWLWEGRVPFGKVTVMDGDPGLGKSTLAIDLAARLSVGRELPGGPRPEAADVLILSAEDGLADTIRPRLEAVGAEMKRIHAMTAAKSAGGVEVFPSIHAHVNNIGDAVCLFGARLVIIDPLMAYLGGDINAFRDQDVRRALAPLSAMAGETRAAIILVRHLRKSGRDHGAISAGGGSIGIGAAARSVLLVAKDPNDQARRIVASAKSNLSRPPVSLAFRIISDERGRPTVAWEGPVDLSADELLAASQGGDEDRSALEKAKEFLLGLLAGGPRFATEIFSLGSKDGHSEITLRRAKAILKIDVRKVGPQWQWSLPSGGDGRDPGKVLIPADERLDHLDSGERPIIGPSASATGGAVEAYRSSGQSPGVLGAPARPCSYHSGPLDKSCERCGSTYREHLDMWGAS